MTAPDVAFLAGLDRLTEAMQRHAAARRLAPYAPSLEATLVQHWARQKRMTVTRLGKHRERFPVLVERLSDSDWMADWRMISLETGAALTAALQEVMRSAFAAGAQGTISAAQVALAFDVATDPGAVQWLSARAAARVSMIDETTRKKLRQLLTQAGREGWSWNRTARQIETMFDGFTGRGTAPRHLRTRGELVAVTELADAMGEGQAQVRGRYRELGLAVKKSWVTVGDDRVDPHCLANEAAGWIDDRESFPSGADREPDHPGCRCAVVAQVLVPGETT